MDKIKYRIKLLNLLNYLDNILLWYYNVIIKNSSNRIVHEQNGRSDPIFFIYFLA